MSSRHAALLGWLMFAISGIFFLIDAIDTGDKTALGSAVTWLVGVVLFVWGREADAPDAPDSPDH